MSILAVQLTAEQPLLLTSLQGDPNSSVSFRHIPGSAIRGALVQRYQANNGPLDLENDIVQRRFFNGTTRYLHGYPLLDQTPSMIRLLPTPRSWFQPKDATNNEAFDLSMAQVEPPERRERISNEFCWLDVRGNALLSSIARHVNIHNQRDRERGRGFEQSGAVFRYEAIAPGQTFQTLICCDDSDAPLFESLLKGQTLWIGGSRSAGYGKVSAQVTHLTPSWNEVGTSLTQRGTAGEEFHLTLLSDLISRDANGQFVAALPLTELQQVLGVSNLAVVTERSFQASVYHGGFNRTWGLPLPQTIALAAGSVFVLRGEMPKVEALQLLEERGLGERRLDGFGRVAVNWHPKTPSFWYEKKTITEVSLSPKDTDKLAQTIQESVTPPVVSKESTSEALARLMAERLLRQQLELALSAKVSAITGEISNTQLSRLRIVARRAMADPETQGMQRIQNLLKHLPKNAEGQFAAAQFGSTPLRQWLDSLISNPMQNWQTIKPVTVAGEHVGVTPALAREFTLRLIMAVARQSVKEGRV